MALKKKPVNGMRDILPEEAYLRDYVTNVIKETYRSFGFTPIETPLLEEIGNLSNDQGGENEKLIFKVLKRGEKLDLSGDVREEDIVDYGIRYDLTVPLSRFFANNENDLKKPFKALQIGPVFRADRPQKGRYREFTQCDIDIIGEPSYLAECELITATSKALSALSFKGFKIIINDRRLLTGMAKYAGFPDDGLSKLFIILDKLDKIGLSGVRDELIESGFSKDSIEKYLSLFEALSGKEDVKEALLILEEKMGESFPKDAGDDLSRISKIVQSEDVKEADFRLVFDPTLVRGMGYYTGPVFEIRIEELSISCGGGGRYDNMVGLFSGHPTPACGFSIGFERIILLLKERGFKIPGEGKKIAILLDKGLSEDELMEAYKEAAKLRKEGNTVLVERLQKNKKFQKEILTNEGYSEVIEKWQSR
ncbi:MAG: histidine--tRNA ligase [Lachnospiraceae bacterium]|nr:histidine--tRNA ligase [Lachnospiraceae bacterium]